MKTLLGEVVLVGSVISYYRHWPGKKTCGRPEKADCGVVTDIFVESQCAAVEGCEGETHVPVSRITAVLG